MNLSNIEEGLIKQDCGEQQMPCWSAFNTVVTDEKVPERIVGFLPILPHPVTKYNIVYTALKISERLGTAKSEPLGYSMR